MNLDLQVDFEDETFLRLRNDLLELRIQIMRFADGIRPIQVQDGRRHDFRLVAARIQRIFAGAKRLLPNAAMARADERTVLEVRAAGVLRSESYVSLDDTDLALLDDEHRHHFHAD